MDLKDVWKVIKDFGLSEANRPIRLRLSQTKGMLDDVLMVQRVEGKESLCGGLYYTLMCVSTSANLPLKEFIALPVEIQFVTDLGQTRSVCGIVTSAQAGESDGGLATYKLEVRDALSIMEKRVNTRQFMKASELDITLLLLKEWRDKNTVLTRAFDIDASKISTTYPTREFTMQHNESDASFLRRLWKRAGISWYIEPGSVSDRLKQQDDTPLHRVVLFDDVRSLAPNRAGNIRYHRNDATEERDSITAWSGVRTLSPATLNRQSWDYQQAGLMSLQETSRQNQGSLGNTLAACLDEYLLDVPHAGDDLADYQRLGQLRMLRHEFESKCFMGESGVRDMCVGQWNSVIGHAELDGHSPEDRQFVITELTLEAENNLPKPLGGKLRERFSGNGWLNLAQSTLSDEEGTPRYRNRFTAVRRSVAIVPHFDAQRDLPRPQLQTAIVVGPEGEEVHCDEWGRVKIRFPGTRPEDHQHSGGAGASDSDVDSAWIRVSSSWAGASWGTQTLPRIGQEVLIDFLGGDPDKPIIISALYNGAHPPPAFSNTGKLPENRFVSGTKSKEIGKDRYNQLRYDDTKGQINIQLASQHGYSELNLGWLTHPRLDGSGRPRGEGFELRTDAQGAIRAAKGLWISTEQQLAAQGGQMGRYLAESLSTTAINLALELGAVAVDSKAAMPETGDKNCLKKADGSDGGTQSSGHHYHLKQAIKSWERGNNTDEKATTGDKDQLGGQALVVIASESGLAEMAAQSLLHSAGTNLDQVAQRDTNQTTGRRWVHNVGQHISLFVQGVKDKASLKLIAALGKVQIKALSDELLLFGDKTVTITSNQDAVHVLAQKEILLASGGAYIRLKGGAIEIHCPASLSLKGNGISMKGPTSLAAEFNKAPETKFEKEVILRLHNGEPAKNRKVELIREDGSRLRATTDENGRLGVQKSDIFGAYTITILD